MNCKPGDIAIARSGRFFEHQFAVLEAVPVGVYFYLPNGVRHRPVAAGYWVVESLSCPVPCVKGNDVLIGCAPDHRLISLGSERKAGTEAVESDCVTMA